jgi:hypothetical protein
VRVDVRVVSATARNLPVEIAEGRFREDLYYRLNVVPVLIPGLCDRREDIPALVEHFVAHYAAQRRVPTPEVAPDAIAALQSYEWPGNVRQLRNVVERTVILAPGDRIGRIDVAIGPSLALISSDAANVAMRLADPFSEAVAGLIAAKLGVRLFLAPVDGPFQSLELLLSGEVDLVLPPLMMRPLLRRVMFATPHGEIEAVVIGAGPMRLRAPAQLAGRDVAVLSGLAAALTDQAEGAGMAMRVLPLENILQVEAALRAGVVTFAAVLRHQGRQLLARNPALGLREHFVLNRFAFAPALRYGAHDLLRAVNLALADAQHDKLIAPLFENFAGLPWVQPRSL